MSFCLSDDEKYRVRTWRTRDSSHFLEMIKNRTYKEVHSKTVIIACDHPARGVLNIGSDEFQMGDRVDLLDRIALALDIPGVDGVLASSDIIDDLTYLGKLENKIVFATMNRGGIKDSSFEANDTFTGSSAECISSRRLNGGKILLRMDLEDETIPGLLARTANEIDALHALDKYCMIEPFIAFTENGNLQVKVDSDSQVRAISIASALGSYSYKTILKLNPCPEMERVLGATTLPVMLLGGDPSANDHRELWKSAMKFDQVIGLVAGRSLLYPSDNNVKGAVYDAVEIVKGSI